MLVRPTDWSYQQFPSDWRIWRFAAGLVYDLWINYPAGARHERQRRRRRLAAGLAHRLPVRRGQQGDAPPGPRQQRHHRQR